MVLIIIMSEIKEILEMLEDQTIDSIEEFRQEWISSLNVDERFRNFNLKMINEVCNMANRKATA